MLILSIPRKTSDLPCMAELSRTIRRRLSYFSPFHVDFDWPNLNFHCFSSYL